MNFVNYCDERERNHRGNFPRVSFSEELLLKGNFFCPFICPSSQLLSKNVSRRGIEIQKIPLKESFLMNWPVQLVYSSVSCCSYQLLTDKNGLHRFNAFGLDPIVIQELDSFIFTFSISALFFKRFIHIYQLLLYPLSYQFHITCRRY